MEKEVLAEITAGEAVEFRNSFSQRAAIKEAISLLTEKLASLSVVEDDLWQRVRSKYGIDDPQIHVDTLARKVYKGLSE